MLWLSQTAGYAILALSCLDDSGARWTLAKQIAARTRVPHPYLSKILHALAKGRLIRAKRGYQGGFMLARSARKLTVLDVVLAVDGDQWLGSCLLGFEACSDKRSCPAHAFWKPERARIRAYLAQLSLLDVAAFQRDRNGWGAPDGARDVLHGRRPLRRGDSTNDRNSGVRQNGKIGASQARPKRRPRRRAKRRR